MSQAQNLGLDSRQLRTKATIITVRNEVAKVMFLQVCVCPKGGRRIPACLAGGIPACLSTGLQGVPAPGGACSGGACSQGGVPAPRGYLPPGGGETPPTSRRLLLQTVRILLECILVKRTMVYAILKLTNVSKIETCSSKLSMTQRVLGFNYLDIIEYNFFFVLEAFH